MREEDIEKYLQELESKLEDASKYIEYIEKDIYKFRLLFQELQDDKKRRSK